MFSKEVAIIALLIVATQVIFFVQASFVFPEMMVAMFAFLSLYYYANDRLLLTSMMLFMLFFAKESGLVFGAVICGDALILLFRSRGELRRRLLRMVAVLIPVALAGLFFVLQKAKMGWYLLPEHTGMIHADWNSFYAMFRISLYWTYYAHSVRHVLTGFIVLLSLIPAVNHKNARYLFLCLPAVFVFILTTIHQTDNTAGPMSIVLLLLGTTSAVHYFLQLNKTMGTPARRFIILMVVGIVGYWFFLSLSQPAYRYLLVNIILSMVFLSVCTGTYIAASGKPLFYVAITGILIIGGYGFYSNEWNNDTDMEAFNAMNVQLKVVAWLEKEKAYDKEIAAACGWEALHFTDTLEGFLSSGRIFSNIKHFPVRPAAEYAVFDNICGDDNEYDKMRKNPDYHLAVKITDSRAWAEIYQHN